MTKRHGRSGGILLTLGILFAASAALRIAHIPEIGIGFQAAANSTTQSAENAEIATLLVTLKEREARLSERENALAERTQSLNVAEKGVQTRMAALQSAETDLSSKVTFADSAADSDVSRLVAIYENMKPREAAPLFEAMEPRFAAGFLGRMRPETAAAIMASLDPKFAYSVSVLFVGRNAGAPQN